MPVQLTLRFVDGTETVEQRAFENDNASAGFLVASDRFRTDAVPLDGARIDPGSYIFYVPSPPRSPIGFRGFAGDDPAFVHGLAARENFPPFDVMLNTAPGSLAGAAFPLPEQWVTGTYRIDARADGAAFDSVSFSVR
ncbi:MAG: hypothetical protein AAF411_03245 [Myxococcota bacterium]